MRGQAIYHRAPSNSIHFSDTHQVFFDPFTPSAFFADSPASHPPVSRPLVRVSRRRERGAAEEEVSSVPPTRARVSDVHARNAARQASSASPAPDSLGENEAEAAPRAKRTRR